MPPLGLAPPCGLRFPGLSFLLGHNIRQFACRLFGLLCENDGKFEN